MTNEAEVVVDGGVCQKLRGARLSDRQGKEG